MQKNNASTDNAKSKTTFKRGLLSFFLFSMAAIFVGLFWFWGFLERYELSTPKAALAEFTQLVKSGNYEEIYVRSGLEESTHNTKEDFILALKNAFPQSATELSYQKRASKNGEKLYAVFADDRESGTIELVDAQKNSKFAFTARAKISADISITINAPEYVTVFLNEHELPQSDAAPNETTLDYFKALPPEQQPRQLTYKKNQLLSKPIVTAKKADGSACAVVEKGGVYTITSIPNQEIMQMYTELIDKGAKTYAAFVSKDASFATFDALVWKGSPIANGIRNFSNMWYISHDSFAYENVVIKDIEEYSETAFTGIISFDHVIKRGAKENIFPSKYRMIFLKQDNVWKIYDLHVL